MVGFGLIEEGLLLLMTMFIPGELIMSCGGMVKIKYPVGSIASIKLKFNWYWVLALIFVSFVEIIIVYVLGSAVK